MPRILICTNSYPPQIGGLATYSSQLAIHLGELDFDVTVLAPKSPDFKAFDEDKHLLEKMQAQIAADPRGMDFLEVTLGADGAGIKVRQILNNKLAAEGRSIT